MIRLRAWGNAWIEYRLKGRGKRPLAVPKRASQMRKVHGFGSYEPVYWLVRRFYAVYGDSGRFIFQAGREYWDLTEGSIALRFDPLSRGMASEFSVIRGGDLIHQVKLIHPGRSVWPRIDPTYDYIDAETDHFFLLLHNEMHKDAWRQRIIDMAASAD